MLWQCLALKCLKECNMNLTNYHSHCSFCDGIAPMEEFVKSAISAGFTAYGISSHAPLPFSTKWTMEKDRLPTYLSEFEILKSKYADQIELYAGLEIDYLTKEHNPSSSFFQNLPLDYRIGSVHMVYTDEGEIFDTDQSSEAFKLALTNYHGDLKQLVKYSFEASMQMVELGGFDFIAHPDKIAFNASCYESGVDDKSWYRRMREDLFALIAEKELIMEINTKAFANKARFFPAQKHFGLIHELGIRVVVNSDAHSPELVNSGRAEALQVLKEVGVKTVCELHGGSWQEVAIY